MLVTEVCFFFVTLPQGTVEVEVVQSAYIIIVAQEALAWPNPFFVSALGSESLSQRDRDTL